MPGVQASRVLMAKVATVLVAASIALGATQVAFSKVSGSQYPNQNAARKQDGCPGHYGPHCSQLAYPYSLSGPPATATR
jgi:hypothetical protein